MQTLTISAILFFTMTLAYLVAVTFQSFTRRASGCAFLLSFALAAIVTLSAITAADYTAVATIVKSCLTADQIEFIRGAIAIVTNGNGVLVFLQVCLSQLISLIYTSCAVIGICCAVKKAFQKCFILLIRRFHARRVVAEYANIISQPSLLFVRLLQ